MPSATLNTRNNYLNIIRLIFSISGIFDIVLGIIVFLLASNIYASVSHFSSDVGILKFGGLLTIIFAMMAFRIALDFNANKNLIIYEIMYKLAFCTITFTQGASDFVFKIAIINTLFLLAFICSYIIIRNK